MRPCCKMRWHGCQLHCSEHGSSDCEIVGTAAGALGLVGAVLALSAAATCCRADFHRLRESLYRSRQWLDGMGNVLLVREWRHSPTG